MATSGRSGSTVSTKVGNIDIQFGKDYDQTKANQLVQSLQQTIAAVNTLANQIATPASPSDSVAPHVLATQAGLGEDQTTEGLEANQVLIATSPTEAHFAFLTFGQLGGADPNSFAAAENGDVIAFVNGYWSAVSNAQGLGLSDPGANSLIMWDTSADSGNGALAWAMAGNGIVISSGKIAVDAGELTHGDLLGLLADDHPQYALIGAPNTWADPQGFAGGFSSGADITLVGNLIQSGAQPDQVIVNTDDSPDEGAWRMHVEPGQQMFASVADDGSDGEDWLVVQREGELVDTVNVQAAFFTYNGFDVACATIAPGAGPMPATVAGYLTFTVAGVNVLVPYTA